MMMNPILHTDIRDTGHKTSSRQDTYQSEKGELAPLPQGHERCGRNMLVKYESRVSGPYLPIL